MRLLQPPPRAKQQKYACRCGDCVETAPGPERAIKGGRYSLAFAVKVAIDKYLDHLPLNRQARIIGRHAFTVRSQTLWDQLHALAMRLRVVWEALLARVMREPVIGLDQTSWKRLDTKKAKVWQIWCLTAPGAVYHHIYGDKSVKTLTASSAASRGSSSATRSPRTTPARGRVRPSCSPAAHPIYPHSPAIEPQPGCADVLRLPYSRDASAGPAEARPAHVSLRRMADGGMKKKLLIAAVQVASCSSAHAASQSAASRGASSRRGTTRGD